ncbi:MAG: hypothetical protein ACJ8HI_16280 [Massilia sp.]
MVTISATPNFPRSGNPGDGFAYDSPVPLPIDVWCQPGNLRPGCQFDRHFSLHWSVK